MKVITKEEAVTSLQEIAGWNVKDEKWIERRFKFQEFTDGIDFVNKVADIAEAMDHHPFISIQYKIVTLSLTSWNAGGLTTLDLEAASKYNALYQDMK
ncbi:4a-hydroxytetrahydrobiopterin dehydratase [Rossellomorea vietnamensis]|uniref:4a-hydroxytetrahydrobiopterin dehydratase n=1 Tax=Rossellomorea vietnamensis TaxID=218284 RepID=A0A5D4M9C0_9BACI|nr:4a-hydroxytetrahydrobiopterin dehydratase [Rossellomorea vietnamensis]TYR98037.1 4a-hydroxytetrahydrobiopterin dehydratase [Rossellomorea vietnamensis]